MNTTPPDETVLALWLDDELSGVDLATVEAWAATRPEQLAAREGIRHWRTALAAVIPASEEPPYPDFFNSRVMQGIRDSAPQKTASTNNKALAWKSWWIPATACAGMALTFWAGTKTQHIQEINVAGAPRAIPVEPAVYTPEHGVKAEWFASAKASATVIVLNGVAAIPDTTDFSPTADVPMDREIDATADAQGEPMLEPES